MVIDHLSPGSPLPSATEPKRDSKQYAYRTPRRYTEGVITKQVCNDDLLEISMYCAQAHAYQFTPCTPEGNRLQPLYALDVITAVAPTTPSLGIPRYIISAGQCKC